MARDFVEAEGFEGAPPDRLVKGAAVELAPKPAEAFEGAAPGRHAVAEDPGEGGGLERHLAHGYVKGTGGLGREQRHALGPKDVRAVPAVKEQFAHVFRPCDDGIQAGVFARGVSIVVKPAKRMRSLLNGPGAFRAKRLLETPAGKMPRLFEPEIAVRAAAVEMAVNDVASRGTVLPFGVGGCVRQ